MRSRMRQVALIYNATLGYDVKVMSGVATYLPITCWTAGFGIMRIAASPTPLSMDARRTVKRPSWSTSSSGDPLAISRLPPYSGDLRG
jgi:hypothetical protein